MNFRSRVQVIQIRTKEPWIKERKWWKIRTHRLIEHETWSLEKSFKKLNDSKQGISIISWASGKQTKEKITKNQKFESKTRLQDIENRSSRTREKYRKRKETLFFRQVRRTLKKFGPSKWKDRANETSNWLHRMQTKRS